jgi:quercetin dioxygenase-like cupin family protein
MHPFFSFIPMAMACLGLAACSSPFKDPAHPTAIEREVLLQSSESWDGTPYISYPTSPPELTLLKLKIPANKELAWHTHPIPNAAYILSGKLTVESHDGKHVRELKAGDALAEMVDISHRGKTGDEPVELIVFYAGSEGIALSQ